MILQVNVKLYLVFDVSATPICSFEVIFVVLLFYLLHVLCPLNILNGLCPSLKQNWCRIVNSRTDKFCAILLLALKHRCQMRERISLSSQRNNTCNANLRCTGYSSSRGISDQPCNLMMSMKQDFQTRKTYSYWCVTEMCNVNCNVLLRRQTLQWVFFRWHVDLFIFSPLIES